MILKRSHKTGCSRKLDTKVRFMPLSKFWKKLLLTGWFNSHTFFIDHTLPWALLWGHLCPGLIVDSSPYSVVHWHEYANSRTVLLIWCIFFLVPFCYFRIVGSGWENQLFIWWVGIESQKSTFLTNAAFKIELCYYNINYNKYQGQMGVGLGWDRKHIQQKWALRSKEKRNRIEREAESGGEDGVRS